MSRSIATFFISVNLSNDSIFILCYEDVGKEVQCACIRQPHLTWLDLVLKITYEIARTDDKSGTNKDSRANTR